MEDLHQEAFEAFGSWLEAGEISTTIVDPEGNPPENAQRVSDDDIGKLLVNIEGMKPGCVVLLMPKAPKASVSACPEHQSSQKLKRLRSYFRKIDRDDDGTLCRGELRVLLWQLQLTETQFATLFEKFDVKGNGVVELDELMYLIGAQFLENKAGITVEQLMLQAAETLLKMELEKDVELGAVLRGEEVAIGAEDGELGHDRFSILESNAKGDGAMQSAKTNFFTANGQILLIVGVFVCALVALIIPGLRTFLLIVAGACALVYWVSFVCLKKGVNEALMNAVEGMEEVLGRIEAVEKRNPVYSWSIECFHWETRTSADGKSSRQEKVVTHSNSRAGDIPSVDCSNELIPNTSVPYCVIECGVSLNFNESNYTSKFNEWVAQNDRDEKKNVSRSEHLPGVCDILACWIKDHRPWWLSIEAAAVAHFIFCGPCHRLKADSAVTHQKHVYCKICQNM